MPEVILDSQVEFIMPEPLIDILRHRFSHEAFRPGQAPVVQSAIDGHDLLAVMPSLRSTSTEHLAW